MVAPRPFTAYVATTRYYVKATDDESTLTPPAHRREGRGVQPGIWNVIGNDVRPASWSWEVQEGAPPVAPAAAKTPPRVPGSTGTHQRPEVCYYTMSTKCES